MPDILIRGLSKESVERIDAAASGLGLSRSEYLRRRFEDDRLEPDSAVVSDADWRRSAKELEGLGDPEVMDEAWR